MNHQSIGDMIRERLRQAAPPGYEIAPDAAKRLGLSHEAIKGRIRRRREAKRMRPGDMIRIGTRHVAYRIGAIDHEHDTGHAPGPPKPRNPRGKTAVLRCTGCGSTLKRSRCLACELRRTPHEIRHVWISRLKPNPDAVHSGLRMVWCPKKLEE